MADVDYTKVPLLPPPAGVTPNFVDPPNFLAATIALSTVFLTLSTLSFLGRIYAKVRVTHALGYDDGRLPMAAQFRVGMMLSRV